MNRRNFFKTIPVVALGTAGIVSGSAPERQAKLDNVIKVFNEVGPIAEPIVSMVIYHDVIYVATTRSIYALDRHKLERIKFVAT